MGLQGLELQLDVQLFHQEILGEALMRRVLFLVVMFITMLELFISKVSSLYYLRLKYKLIVNTS